MTAEHFDQSFRASAPENYERFFVPAIGRPLAEDLLIEASLGPGERVLDVGCGTGVVARLAAEQVAPEGRVAGVDTSPGMLDVARKATPAGLGIDWYQAKAESLPFDDGSFDVALCQLSLQFMEDRPRAISEMHRVLATEGRVVLNVPGPTEPLFETLAEALDHHVAPGAASFVRAVFSLHEEDKVEELLEGGVFRDIEARAYTRDLALPGAKEFLWQYIGSTPLGDLVASTSAESRTALEAEVLADWARYETPRGLEYSQRVVMASAHR